MNAAQSAAFQAGSGIPPGTLLNAIAASVLVLAFVWVIWVSVGTLRASIVLLVLGFYLR